jgi:hypothetical protein
MGYITLAIKYSIVPVEGAVDPAPAGTFEFVVPVKNR